MTAACNETAQLPLLPPLLLLSQHLQCCRSRLLAALLLLLLDQAAPLAQQHLHKLAASKSSSSVQVCIDSAERWQTIQSLDD
jgi:hypothetical protein